MFAHHLFCATNIEAHMRNSSEAFRAVEPPNHSSWWTMKKEDKKRLKSLRSPDPKINYKEAARNKRRIIIQSRYNVDETCAICLNNMKNTSVKFIPCGHVFHNECLNKLMMSRCSSKNNCPHCRAQIKIYEEEESEEEAESEAESEEESEAEEESEEEAGEVRRYHPEMVDVVTDGAFFTEEAEVFAETAVVFAETRWEADRLPLVYEPAGMFEFDEGPDHG